MRHGSEVHTAVFYVAIFGAMGAHLPFWPIWLQDWGLTAGEVGLYLTSGVFVRVFAGLGFPVIADRLDQRRLTVLVLALVGAATYAAHVLIGSKGVLLAATIVTGACFAGIGPLAEALGAGASRACGFPYARARSAGSVAFLLASLATGVLITRFGVDAALWWIVAFMVLTAVLSTGHPGGGTLQGQKPPGFAQIAGLLSQPTFALFTLCAGMLLSSHAVYYAYGSVHWRDLGLSEARIGALWAFSVAVEVVFMLALGSALVRRLGPVGALTLSAAGGILRWTWMMADPTGAALWFLQAAHTLTFVAGHLGAIAFISQAVPERYSATAQGAFTGLGGGILTAAAMWLSSQLYPQLGGLTYGIAAAMSAVGLVLCLLLNRRWHGGQLAV